MLKTLKKSVGATALICAALLMTACGGQEKNVLKDATLNLTQEGGSQVVTLMTEIDTQSVSIAAATLPINYGGRQLGKVEVVTDVTTNRTYFKATLNISSVLKLPTPNYSSKLPNGTTLPLAGIDLNKVMAFNVGSAGSKAYLYYDHQNKKAVLGIAMNVGNLSVETTGNVFARFDFNNVSGMAGLYFGQAPYKSGVAVFANLSNLFPSSATLAQATQDDLFVEKRLAKSQQGPVLRKLYQIKRSGRAIVLK